MAEAAAFARATYPSEHDVKKALDTMRPVGILSKAYNQFQLKKYECSEVLLTDFAFEVFQRFNNSKMAEYPGAEYNMSGYGLKTYNPEETKNQWVETCKREEALRNNHVVTQGQEGVSGTWKIKKREEPDITQTISYFKAKTTHGPPSTYDRINHVVEGYNQKLHRDDREHTKSRGLKVNSEETRVKVPVLSSSIYGHPARKPLEWNDRSHVRVELCKKDFLRLGGTNIGENPDLH